MEARQVDQGVQSLIYSKPLQPTNSIGLDELPETLNNDLFETSVCACAHVCTCFGKCEIAGSNQH